MYIHIYTYIYIHANIHTYIQPIKVFNPNRTSTPLELNSLKYIHAFKYSSRYIAIYTHIHTYIFRPS